MYLLREVTQFLDISARIDRFRVLRPIARTHPEAVYASEIEKRAPFL